MVTLVNMTKQYYYSVKIGKVYRVTAEPKIKSKTFHFPGIGAFGKCQWTSSHEGACLLINDQSYLIPFECIEEYINNVDDSYLISLITDNPKRTFKLLKGLWRMTKHKTIRDLMERGELPTDGVEVTGISDKKSEDFDKQWEECLTSGAFEREIVS